MAVAPMEQLVATERRFLSRRQARARRGDTADNQAASIDANTLDTSSEHENRDKATTDVLEKVKVPNIVQMEKKTNQDTVKPLPWDNLWGMALVSHINAKNKTKDQPITLAGKENTVTTSAGKKDDIEHRLHSY